MINCPLDCTCRYGVPTNCFSVNYDEQYPVIQRRQITVRSFNDINSNSAFFTDNPKFLEIDGCTFPYRSYKSFPIIFERVKKIFGFDEVPYKECFINGKYSLVKDITHDVTEELEMGYSPLIRRLYVLAYITCVSRLNFEAYHDKPTLTFDKTSFINVNDKVVTDKVLKKYFPNNDFLHHVRAFCDSFDALKMKYKLVDMLNEIEPSSIAYADQIYRNLVTCKTNLAALYSKRK